MEQSYDITYVNEEESDGEDENILENFEYDKKIITTALDNENEINISGVSAAQQNINKALMTVLTNGTGLSSICETLAEFDAPIPDSNKFYYEQKKLVASGLDLAVKSCKECYEASHTMIAAIDGAWNCVRNAQFCIIDLIDCQTAKLVDFQIVTSNTYEWIKHENLTQGIKSAPNTFEGIGAEIIARRHPLRNANIFVHDKDVKMRDLLINKCNLRIQEKYDPNHISKHLFKPLNANTHPLHNFRGKLRSTFMWILHNIEPEKRIDEWKSLYDKIISNPNFVDVNQKISAALKDIIQEASIYYPLMDPICHTNYNESFHSLRCLLTPKHVDWGYSWVIRSCITIIRYNHKDNWRTIIRNWLKAPLPNSTESRKYLLSKENKAKYDHQRRDNIAYKKKNQKGEISQVTTKKKQMFFHTKTKMITKIIMIIFWKNGNHKKMILYLVKNQFLVKRRQYYLRIGKN